MGTEMEKENVYETAEYNDKTYYFCCGGCKPEFLKNPEKYILDPNPTDYPDAPLYWYQHEVAPDPGSGAGDANTGPALSC